MRILEVRRHTHRNVPQPHLSQLGVDLARRVGNDLGPFHRVVTSPLPRAFETAIAMGYAVDEQIEQLGIVSDEVTAAIQWNAGFTTWAKVAQNNSTVAQHTRALAELFLSIVYALPEGGRALIITHGGIVEAGAVGCVRIAGLNTTGTLITDAAACGYCEGVRLTFEDDRVTRVEVLRVEQP